MNQTDAQLSSLPNDVYFASVPREKLPDTIRAKALAFRRRLDREGKTDIWRIAERTYYGRDPDGGWANSVAVTYGGDDGELVCIRVNHFRSIIKGLLATVTKERPAFDAVATSSDSESLAAAHLADALLEYYYREAGLESVRLEVDTTAILLAEGFTALRWNPHVGKVHVLTERQKYQDGVPLTETVMEEPSEEEIAEAAARGVALEPREAERPVMEPWAEREGDVEAQLFGPIEVVRDLDSVKQDLEWCCVPYRENVWNLAARYPEHAPQILALRGTQQRWPRTVDAQGSIWQKPDPEQDLVDVWHLYHMPCDALPEGRLAMTVGDVVLWDGPMTLPEVPVYPLIPEKELRRGSGYSFAWDMLALQEAHDALWETILSAHDAFGLQNILAGEGTNLKPELVARGLQLLNWKPNPAYTDGGKPEAVNFLSIPKESFDLLDLTKVAMETLSGINSVVRGDPMPQLKSGAALALVQSLAVAFNSTLAAAITKHDERVATGLLRLLQKFAVNKRTVEVVGRANARSLKEWSASSLKGVSRVSVQIVSTLLQHTAGKMEIADKMWQATKPDGTREITTAQYFEILTTGRLEPAYQGPTSELENIQRENELMADMKPVRVLLTDDHGCHVNEHKAVLASPEVRADDRKVQFVLQHIAEHQRVWATMGPELSALTQQSIAAPALPVAGPPPGTPPNEGAPTSPPQPAPPAPRAKPLGKEGPSDLPQMPVIAGTNVRAPNP